MNYTLFDFFQLVGSLGIFIYGMKVFSDGLQKVAGSRLRSILKGMATTRFKGILTGFGATTITQSSTTTTVMVVSFVNAGLITFIESTGVIMGGQRPISPHLGVMYRPNARLAFISFSM